MAVSVLKYSSVNAKARAMSGKLLTKADYEALLGKKSVPEIAAYLKRNTNYGDVLSEINENEVHRGELEILFKSSLYNDFHKLFRFLRGNSQSFLKAIFLRYEIEDLKMLLRITYTGRDTEAVKDSLIFLKRHSRLNYDKLIRSKDIGSLVDNLKGTVYYKVLSPFVESKGHHILFDMEMTLDLHFFMMILKLKDKLLSGSDKDSVVRSFGMEVDILNILMIYRCKKLFNLPKEVTLNHVIPFWHHLRREQLVQLAESSNLENFVRLVSTTKYADVFKVNEEHLWEVNSMRYMYRYHKSRLRRDCFNLGSAIAYLHLKEMDIRDIIIIIEGIRYSLPIEEITSYLIGI